MLADAPPLPGVSITDRFEYRAPALPGWARGEPTGETELAFWMRFRDGRDADPIALTAPIELTVHVRARPAPGWVACRASTRHVIGGYHEEDFEIWDSAGALVAQSRQFALLVE